MAMIADRLHKDYSELYGLNDASDKRVTFAVFLSGAVDEAFKHGIRDLSFDNATMAYCQQDFCDEAYDKFWEHQKQLAVKVAAVRNSLYCEARLRE
jgi:hypothetical protein